MGKHQLNTSVALFVAFFQKQTSDMNVLINRPFERESERTLIFFF